MPADAHPAFAERIIEHGARWGLHTESEIAELAMLIMEIRIVEGPQRPMPAWFAEVVEDDSLNSQAKLYKLVRRWKRELDHPVRTPQSQN